jgi:hypothetical protein
MLRHLTIRAVTMWVLVSFATTGVWGCAAGLQARPPEQLYFAIQMEQDGRSLAAPRLLGFEGKRVFAEKWRPGAALPDYRLLLQPDESGAGYGVSLDLELPSGHSRGRIDLLHGEERTIALDTRTRLTLLLMRVDSPEFRALMHQKGASEPSSI